MVNQPNEFHDTIAVNGMTCDHCVNAVTDELKKIEGVTDVKVELHPDAASKVDITSMRPIDDHLVAAAIDEAGYELA